MERFDRWTRRGLLKVGAGAASGVAVSSLIPAPLLVRLGNVDEVVPDIRDPRIREIAIAAVEAAKKGGASYADARLTFTRKASPFMWGNEALHIGVRALASGYWGFASSQFWTKDEAVRLGTAAAAEAQYNATSRKRPMEMAPVPIVNSEHWQTPVEIDPFEIPRSELNDHVAGLRSHISLQNPGIDLFIGWSCERQDKAFASSEGSYFTQRRDQFGVNFMIEYANGEAYYEFPMSDSVCAGWEYLAANESGMIESVPGLMQQIEEDNKIPFTTLDPGRYNAVFDAYSTASFIHSSIGVAAELDRAMGYEANVGGTSYLSDPLEMLGSYKIGDSKLTVTTNRSTPKALGNIGWDDDGVSPVDATLVKEGMLHNFITTRESVSWIKDYYANAGLPYQSQGNSLAPDASLSPTTHLPNLVMSAGAANDSFDSLVAGLESGIAVKYGGSSTDFQQSSGLGSGLMYEVKKGKKVGRVRGLAYLYRTPEPWKELIAIGGEKSRRWAAQQSSRGEPTQTISCSVSAVPILTKEMTFVDPTRRS